VEYAWTATHSCGLTWCGGGLLVLGDGLGEVLGLLVLGDGLGEPLALGLLVGFGLLLDLDGVGLLRTVGTGELLGELDFVLLCDGDGLLDLVAVREGVAELDLVAVGLDGVGLVLLVWLGVPDRLARVDGVSVVMLVVLGVAPNPARWWRRRCLACRVWLLAPAATAAVSFAALGRTEQSTFWMGGLLPEC
jgi:hypothetical protein